MPTLRKATEEEIGPGSGVYISAEMEEHLRQMIEEECVPHRIFHGSPAHVASLPGPNEAQLASALRGSAVNRAFDSWVHLVGLVVVILGAFALGLMLGASL